MEISTSTNICAFQRGRERLPVEFSIDECARAGYRVLDMNFCIAMNPDSPMRADGWADYVRGIGAYARARGIRFTQSHLPYYDAGKGTDDRMEELIRRSIIGSSMLGVRWCVTHPITRPGAFSQLEENLRYFAPLVELARAQRVGIALENDFITGETLYGASVEEVCELVDAFGDAGTVGVCYDFGHGNLMGGAHRDNLRRIGGRLRAIHVQDNHGTSDEHLLPLYGSIDWQECMEGLAEIGWTGELTFEAQEFGRYLPKEMKHLAVEQSLEVGRYLAGLYEKAKERMAHA